MVMSEKPKDTVDHAATDLVKNQGPPFEALIEELNYVIENCSGPQIGEPEGVTAMPTELALQVLDELRMWRAAWKTIHWPL